MPPRKKAAATAAPSEPAPGVELKSYYLPKSTISKLAKSALPEGVSLQKEIPEALQQGSVVFINYLAALAHDIASEKGQKTITAAHIQEAAKQLGWDETELLRKNLKSELNAFRKAADAKKAGAGPSKPRVPGAPVGRPPKASTSTSTSTSAAAAATTATAAAAAPSAPRPRASATVEAAELDDEGEDERMTVLQDDRAPADEGEEDQQAYGTADEEEEDDEEMAEDDEEEEEDEPEPEEEEDRVGAGLEEDDEMGGGSGADD